MVSLTTERLRRPRLQAISVGNAAASRIRGRGEIGRVHGVFRGAINIMLRDGHMVSVVETDVGRGPVNVVVNPRRGVMMDYHGLKNGDPVQGSNGDIVFGEGKLTVSLGNVPVHRSKRKFSEKLNSFDGIKENLLAARATVLKSGRLEGLGELIGLVDEHGLKPHNQRRLNPYASIAVNSVRHLLRAMRAGTVQDVRSSARDLIGLGPGLTPSADDLLSGLMLATLLFAENLDGDAKPTLALNRRISSQAAGRTTTLSREYLEQAAEGEGNERIVSLIERLFTAGRQEVEGATERVTKIGETSGTDTVVGIVLGAQLSLDGPV